MTEHDKPTPGAPVAEETVEETEVLEAVERATGGRSDAAPVENSVDSTPLPADGDEMARREALAQVDTQLDMRLDGAQARTEVLAPDEMPSAAAEPEIILEDTPARDGEIRISSDHPMAALYMQSPMPPDLKGNRGAGSLIALLATVGFTLVLAAVYAIWIMPTYPPSTYVSEGIIPMLTNWGFIAAIVGFVVALILLVLIVGRAGWWAYVLGGFLVGVVVWVCAAVGAALYARYQLGETVWLHPLSVLQQFGFTMPAITAGIVAREATIWFGAWIGFRGRRVRARNAELLEEYETALAEVQANRP